MVSSVRSTIRSSVPCRTTKRLGSSLGIQVDLCIEYEPTSLDCQVVSILDSAADRQVSLGSDVRLNYRCLEERRRLSPLRPASDFCRPVVVKRPTRLRTAVGSSPAALEAAGMSKH